LYEVQGWYQEGLDQFRYAVEVLGQGDSREHQVVYGWLVGIKGWFMARCGDRDTGQVLLKESIEQLRELDAREELALTQRFLGRLAESDEELREALEGCEAAMAYLGDSNPSRIVSMHIVIADLAKRHGNIVLANKHIAQGEEINMQLDNPRGEAEVDRVRAELEAAEGNSNAATRQFLKSLATYQELGYRHGVVYALKGLGRVANEDGNRGAAIQYYLEALEISVELNLQPSITEILIALIPLHFAPQGDEKVVEILAFMSTHLKPNIEGKTTIESALVDYRDTLADNVFEGAYQRGRQLSIDQIIDDIRDRD
jgi:tetratricopeptide (TPR) repeat protein